MSSTLLKSWPLLSTPSSRLRASAGLWPRLKSAMYASSSRLPFTTVVGVGAILLYFAFPPANSRLLDMALGMQFGGAIGNLIDRLHQGYVTDFFDLRVWPVFNVADSCIVTGVAILAAFLLLTRDEPAPASGAPARETARDG